MRTSAIDYDALARYAARAGEYGNTYGFGLLGKFAPGAAIRVGAEYVPVGNCPIGP